MCIGDLGCLNHLFHGCTFYAESDVVENGVVEKDGLLVDVADKRAQILYLEVPDVASVKEDLAFAYIVVARDKVDEGRLARSGLADKSDHLALRNLQVDIRKDLFAFFVTEAYAFEDDLILESFKRLRFCWISDVVHGIEYLVDTLH